MPILAWLARPVLLAPSGGDLATLPVAALTLDKPARLSVLFAGDTHFGESYAAAPHDYEQALAGVRALTRLADFAVVNLETPLTLRTDSPLRLVKRWAHWGDPDRTAGALYALGVRAVSVANNHAFDALAPGLSDTRAALSGHGIALFGGGEALAEAARPWRADLRIGGHTVHLVVIGALERDWQDWATGALATRTGVGAYPLASRTITGQIRAIKQDDPLAFVIVFPHWGDDYEWRSTAQSELGREMIDAGADLVLGHGAHLFQEIEPYRSRLIFHSLGNFVFLSPGRYRSSGMHPYSLVVHLAFTERGDRLSLEAVVHFLFSDNLATGYRPTVLEGEDFVQAERCLLSGGTLPDASRTELGRLVRRTADEVGPTLTIELGTIRAR